MWCKVTILDGNRGKVRQEIISSVSAFCIGVIESICYYLDNYLRGAMVSVLGLTSYSIGYG